MSFAGAVDAGAACETIAAALAPPWLCPSCASGDVRVLDSRPIDTAIRRRRLCRSCGFRFTTFERIEAL